MDATRFVTIVVLSLIQHQENNLPSSAAGRAAARGLAGVGALRPEGSDFAYVGQRTGTTRYPLPGKVSDKFEPPRWARSRRGLSPRISRTSPPKPDPGDLNRQVRRGSDRPFRLPQNPAEGGFPLHAAQP